MTIHYQDESVTLHHGDCLDVLRKLADNSVDAVVTDPPYDLTAGKKGGSGRASVDLDSPYGRSRISAGNGGFMGKDWDATGVAFDPDTWREVLRVLKPGGHLLSFGGSRTWHRLAVAVEDAGFEIRDSIAWLYGSGFPKSLDVSKAIDKAAGADREVIGRRTLPTGEPRREEGPNTRADGSGWSRPWQTNPAAIEAKALVTAPATAAAEQWEGWGTALKPAFEPVVVGRKPLAGTVSANVLKHGTGALNIDACRIPAGQDYADKCASVVGLGSNQNGDAYGEWTGTREDSTHAAGRWPTNVVLDDSQAAALDQQTGILKTGGDERGRRPRENQVYGKDTSPRPEFEKIRDVGGASRYFPVFRYQAKAPTKERPRVDGVAHPTVKPLEFMRWLVRLVTPPGGVVLEPFAGSGTTVEAALIEGFRCIAIEREADYLPLIMRRLDARQAAMAEQARRAGGPMQMSMLDLLEDGGAA